MKSHFFSLIFEQYNQMGDKISQQYGSSNAHHSSAAGKKKGHGLGEIWTSAKRHINNNYVDPSRQRYFNLFLGIYNPMNHSVPIWNI
jgi:phosphatidylinositol 3,5-bisphosphate 5-phosphatase